MKMLFLFASVKGFNTYLPILTALLERGYTVSTSIIGEPKETSCRVQTVQEEQRGLAFREIKDLNLDILFCEPVFQWLSVGHSHKEHVLQPDVTLEAIVDEIQEYSSHALA